MLKFLLLLFFDFNYFSKIILLGRNSKQCRERWINYLDPKNLRTRFTPEEDEKLLALHQQYGNRWAQISRMLVGRSVSLHEENIF